MLFNTEEKNMMLGAFSAGGLQTIFDAYFGYRLASGVNIAATPTDSAYWLYYNFNYWLPNLSQVISLLGVPLLYHYVGKRRRKFKDMALGAAVYGISELIGLTALKLTVAASGAQGTFSYTVIGRN